MSNGNVSLNMYASSYENKKPMSNTKAALIGGTALMGTKIAADSFQIVNAARKAAKNGSTFTTFKSALSAAWKMFKEHGNVKEELGGLMSKNIYNSFNKTKNYGLHVAVASAAIAATVGAIAGVVIKKIANSGNKDN